MSHVASDLVLTVPAMSAVEAFHPWRRFRALGDAWRLVWHHPDDSDNLGETDFEARTISLRSDLTWEERRCTIAHEVIHAERGPAPIALVEREELIVRRLAARRLLPDIRVVGEALAWSQCRVRGAAEELGVDVDTLWDRLDALHGWEHFYLKNRLAEVG